MVRNGADLAYLGELTHFSDLIGLEISALITNNGQRQPIVGNVIIPKGFPCTLCHLGSGHQHLCICCKMVSDDQHADILPCF